LLERFGGSFTNNEAPLPVSNLAGLCNFVESTEVTYETEPAEESKEQESTEQESAEDERSKQAGKAEVGSELLAPGFSARHFLAAFAVKFISR
jgi:hypothetical protein